MFLPVELDAVRYGVPVGSALREGVLTFADVVAFLAACRECRIRAGRSEESGIVPEGCANRDVIEGLRGLV